MIQGDQRRGGGGGDGRNDDHKEEMKQQQNKQPQPQKCPRCDSLNTKFCYYNNYSLSQPRYFCKTCRRYWTHGGTLRNVPVGGGCRKGKRPRTIGSASSSSSSTSSFGAAVASAGITTSTNTATLTGTSTGLRVKESSSTLDSLVGPAIPPAPGLPPFGFGFHSFPTVGGGGGGGGGGFLSSLAALQPFTHHPGAVGVHMPAELGGTTQGGPPSNLGLLVHGNFSANVPPPILPPHFGSHLEGLHQQQPITRQFYHLTGEANTDHHQVKGSASTDRISTSLAGDHQGQAAISSSSQQQQQRLNWPLHQGLMVVPDTSLWSISTITTTAGANSSTNNVVGSSSDHQWTDHHRLPGYGPSHHQ